jgi:hypothetical protein
MASTVVQITDGPDKPGLQWSLTNGTMVHFDLQKDAADARVEMMEEQPDGFSFRLKGRVTPGVLKGEYFQGFYSVATRSGSLELNRTLDLAE